MTRRTAGLVCLAIVLVAIVLPLVSADVWAVLTPLWIVATTIVATLIRRTAAQCDEQPIALLSLAASRAPPLA